jgi:hypothetical protein
MSLREVDQLIGTTSNKAEVTSSNLPLPLMRTCKKKKKKKKDGMDDGCQ